MTGKHLIVGTLFIGWLGLPVAYAQDPDTGIEGRLNALEQQIQQQQSDFDAQRELLERTIQEQQKNLEAQQRQLSAQFELIKQLQNEQGTERQVASSESDPPAQPASEVMDDNVAESAPGEGPSDGQLAAEAELVKRQASGEESDLVNVKATLYEASNTAFDPDFPGAWHLPGTTAAMKIGGFVNLSLVNSFDPVLITDRFIVGSIPPDGETSSGARSGMDVTASQTRLNFEVREQTNRGTLRAFIEGDFEGDSESFRLRHAFGQYTYLLAGKTWSTFANVNAMPEEVDFEGVNGVVLRRQPQLRVFPKFGKDFSFVASVEEPNTDIVNGSGIKGRWDLVASVDRLPFGEFGNWNYRVSGILRELKGQVGETDEDNPDAPLLQDSATGWGVTTSGRRAFSEWSEDDFLLWQVTYGKGIGRYLNDLSTIGGGDAVFDSNGKLHALPVLAGFLSYRHHWGHKPWFMENWPGFVRSNFTISWINIDTFNFQDDKDYNKTWRASANVLYFPTQNLRLGGELLWGLRQNKDGSDGTATQLQLSARYNF